jgi:hypothetical protein
MFLSDQEVIELTGKQRCNAQSKVLDFLGIRHKIRPDGVIIVLRSVVESALGGGEAKPAQRRKNAPDFSNVP